ncbi:MAG TPA: L-serine ammonia-lyase, iron-sulfur-dependent subunit beta [Anaerovoracaceae bacterium]|nr:L-serine ammonia-lyase, iron-sulfur-dependent subunit beta [Anaerovoracaceae bacterium]
MSVSIFQVAGPVMIGPSSSHTAGAARLGRIAAKLVDDFDFVSFGLHGSFAKTGKGHGTDKALLAGVMGIREDDEAISGAYAIADEAKIGYEFHEAELPGMHENSVRIAFYKNEVLLCTVDGSSLGGGEVLISKIDGYEVELSGNLPTIFIRQLDTRGILSHITTVLAEGSINIATMKVSRKNRSEEATCVIEVDDVIEEGLLKKIEDNPNIYAVKFIKL